MTRRVVVPELMDAPDVSRGDLESAFRFIRLVNRRFGGAAALRRVLAEVVRGWPKDRVLRLVDVGTGCADIPLAMVEWADRAGRPIEVVAIDNHATTLAIAREATADEPRIRVAEANACTLTDVVAPGSFDVAHAGMLLHHLEDIEVMTALRAMQRVARVLVWNDLVRGPLGRLGVRLLCLGASPTVRHDAIVSVEKGFTREEALALARRAGLESPRWRRSLFGRFVVVGGAH